MNVRPALFILVAMLLFTLAGCSSDPAVPRSAQLSEYSAEPYARVLRGAVHDGLVDYAGIDQSDTAPLHVYLDAVARFGPTTTPDQFPTRDDRLAYYLNAYNAIMLDLWLSKGAATTDKADAVAQYWFITNHWTVDGQSTNLNDLEQSLIRPTFHAPRVHAALVCGAMSCPPLRDEPYAGDKLDQQLDDQLHAWLKQPDGLTISPGGDVYLSKIFSWYRDDFDSLGGLVGTLRQYLDDDDPRKPKTIRAAKNDNLHFQPYDWTINTTRNAPPGS